MRPKMTWKLKLYKARVMQKATNLLIRDSTATTLKHCIVSIRKGLEFKIRISFEVDFKNYKRSRSFHQALLMNQV